ncbi:MAG: putative ABC transport system permease protein, partial [Limisphaerales bacterium]
MKSFFDLDKWQEIFSTLVKHKLRTFLTALGVIWGIFMLMVMMGAGKAMENGVMYEFGKWNVRTLFIWTERTTVPYKGLQAGRFINLKMNDMQAIRDRVEGVESVSPRLYLTTDKIVRKDKEGAFSVRGETEAAINIEPLEMILGRFINPIDLNQKRKV